ncbi:hypothetical protein EON78_07485, partial [bacterium]
NVAFLRTSISYLEEFFEENEVDEIWLIHPDPQPRDKEERKRLTNIRYLNLYRKVLNLDAPLEEPSWILKITSHIPKDTFFRLLYKKEYEIARILIRLRGESTDRKA